MNQLTYVVSSTFDSEDLDKTNLVLNLTLSLQFDCDTDYYVSEEVLVVKETETKQTTDGYQTRFYLAIILPVVAMLVLMFLLVKLCLQMKKQGAQVLKYNNVKEMWNGRIRKIQINKGTQQNEKAQLLSVVQQLKYDIQ